MIIDEIKDLLFILNFFIGTIFAPLLIAAGSFYNDQVLAIIGTILIVLCLSLGLGSIGYNEGK